MIRSRILRQLSEGQLTAESPLIDVLGIGPYLYERFQYALQKRPLSVGEFWKFFQNKTTERTLWHLHRVLQNARGNQCVGRSSQDLDKQYHTGDINNRAYEACAALLYYARQNGRVKYGHLPPRLQPRSESSKTCSCKLVCDGPCRTAIDGSCVPRATNTRGFEGVSPQPGQRENSVRKIKSGSRVRLRSPLSRTDPGSSVDVMSGNASRVRYSPMGRTHWRRAGSKVRLPMR